MEHKTIIGTANLVAPAMRMLPAGPPHTCFGVARSMLPGVRTLSAATPLAPLALCLVAAHVLECTLKAYLSRGGSDKAVRASTVRHNIVALWSMAHAQGLAVTLAPPDWVKTLSDLHNSPYHLRYSTGVYGIVKPAIQPMAAELESLVQTVGLAIA